MSGETDLQTLLRTLTARLAEGVYVFSTLPDGVVPGGLAPRMMFREAEGTTVVMLKSEAETHGLPHAFECRMITLDVHSSLDAVGFIARIATELARHGMGVNPVAGYYHDHLFVPDGREGEAMSVLQRVAAMAAAKEED